jgi:hypothetical protein
MSVSCECRALSGRGLCLGWSFVQRSPTECVVSECDGKASIMRKGYGLLGTVAQWQTGNLQRIYTIVRMERL